MAENGNGVPRWWKEWFSPATVLLFFTAIGTVISVTWATSARLNTVELKVSGLEQRESSMESAMVTKDWLAREIQYQRETYAPSSKVDVLGQQMVELQRQLNTIEVLQRQLNDKRGLR